MLAVGFLRGSRDDPDVFEIPNDQSRTLWARAVYTLPRYLQRHQLRGETRSRNLLVPLAEPRRAWHRLQGREDFGFPGTEHLLRLPPVKADLVHCHNLHGDYFDLRYLHELSSRLPVVLTLHDMWAFTGHCAYSIECNRWRTGCGSCPDLSLYPSIRRDKTNQNWLHKRQIYNKSRLFVCAPCQWLIDMAKDSILQAEEYTVIQNGVDQSIFHMGDRGAARAALGVPSDALVLLFVANRARENRYKDYETIEAAVRTIAASIGQDHVVFVSLGGRSDSTKDLGGYHFMEFAFRSSQQEVALFYQAADLFLHAANADTFPTTVIEAQACGLPVVATAVGGIAEQIDDGVTGHLVSRGDWQTMASCAVSTLLDSERHSGMRIAAESRARDLYNLETQVTRYLNWYRDILELR